MTTELLDTDPRTLAGLSTEELRQELARGLRLTAEHLFRLGHVWMELERRGEDLSDLRKGLAVYLPLIASGRVDARAVVRFGGSALLLRCISALPLEEQRRLAEPGATVPVVAEGRVVPKDPAALSAAEMRQVFDRGQGHLRPILDQERLLSCRPEKQVAQVEYDRARQVLKVAGVAVPLADVAAALHRAQTPSRRRGGHPSTAKPVQVFVPTALLTTLKARAVEGGTTVGDLIAALLQTLVAS